MNREQVVSTASRDRAEDREPERAAEQRRACDQQPAAAEQIGGAATEQQEAAIREQIATDGLRRTARSSDGHLPVGFGQAPAQKAALRVGWRELERLPVCDLGLVGAPEAAEQVGSGRREQVVVR